MIKNLDDKGLGQNKVLCSSSRVELLWSTTMQALWRSLHQGDRSPTTRRLLALRTSLTWIPLCHLFLVASSLSPRLVHLGAFRSASCRLSLFLLERLSEDGYWSSHWWCCIDGRRSFCRLVRMVLVERADELSKVLDC